MAYYPSAPMVYPYLDRTVVKTNVTVIEPPVKMFCPVL